MMHLAWCTDIHLDFIDDPGEAAIRRHFSRLFAREVVDGLIVSGDVSLSQSVTRHLSALSQTLRIPIYFVLGNHDFYGGSFDSVRSGVTATSDSDPHLVYLTNEDVVSLTPTVALVGHDGWYDAAAGRPGGSMMMNDWVKISDYRDVVLRPVPGGATILIDEVIRLSREFADAATREVIRKAELAAESHRNVLVVTHVPPFPQVHVDNPKTSSPETMPWYTSHVLGTALLGLAARRPDTRFEVFCGHTHGLRDVRVAPNLVCHVGGSKYGSPDIVGTIRIS